MNGASYTVRETDGITGLDGKTFAKGATVTAGVDFPEAQVTDLLASESIELLEPAGRVNRNEPSPHVEADARADRARAEREWNDRRPDRA